MKSQKNQNKPANKTVVKTQAVEATPVVNKKANIIKKLEAKVAEKKNENKDSSSVTDKVLLGVIVAQILALIYMLLK